MAAIYSNGGNRWNILAFNFTKRDALSSAYKISVEETTQTPIAMSMHFDMGHRIAISKSRHGGLCSIDHGPPGG